MTKNAAKSDDDDGFWANVKSFGGIAGVAIGIGLMSLAWAVVENPTGTIDRAKEAVSHVFNSSSKGSVALPDCRTETSKTVVVDGQAYKISCEP